MHGGDDVQAHDTKSRDKAGVEDVGDTKRKAEDYAQHSSPSEVSSSPYFLSAACA